jgi:hypothetical protein
MDKREGMIARSGRLKATQPRVRAIESNSPGDGKSLAFTGQPMYLWIHPINGPTTAMMKELLNMNIDATWFLLCTATKQQ